MKIIITSEAPNLEQAMRNVREGRAHVETKGQPEKDETTEATGLTPYWRGNGDAVSQADGAAQSAEKDTPIGEEEKGFEFSTPSWDEDRSPFFGMGTGGAGDGPPEPDPFEPTETEETHMAVLGLAGRFLEEAGSAGPYDSVHLEGEKLGQVYALNDLLGALRMTIDLVAPFGRDRAVALTKLDEVSMWVNRAIAKG